MCDLWVQVKLVLRCGFLSVEEEFDLSVIGRTQSKEYKSDFILLAGVLVTILSTIDFIINGAEAEPPGNTVTWDFTMEQELGLFCDSQYCRIRGNWWLEAAEGPHVAKNIPMVAQHIE